MEGATFLFSITTATKSYYVVKELPTAKNVNLDGSLAYLI